MPIRRTLGLLSLLLTAACGPAAPDCGLAVVARMPLTVQDNLLVVPGGINGSPVSLVVDTGAERTTLSAGAAARLGLPQDPAYRTRALGLGGQTTTSDVDVTRLVLGGVHFPVTRVAVGTFRLQNNRGLDADGLLGADILLAFDMDIDVPGGALTLYHARECPESAPPWQEPSVEITGVRTRKVRMLVPFQLDGQDGLAILDTGAGRTVIGVDMARRLGLNDQTLSADRKIRQTGIGPGDAFAYVHRFKTFRIGPSFESNPLIAVHLAEAGIGDALIGESFLRNRRVWLSFRNRQMFVSQRETGQ
jgi:predicted aspartyl protease